MRRFLAILIVSILLWNSASAFVSVTQEVKAAFVPLTAATLVGGQVLPVELPEGIGSFAITYTSAGDIQYEFEARYKDPDSGLWSDWQTVDTDNDMTNPGDSKQFSQVIFTPLSTSLEVRLPATSAVKASFSYLELVTFAPENKIKVGFQPLTAKALQDGFIVTREEWGADNRYLYEKEWTEEHNNLCKDKPWYCAPASAAAIAATEKKSKSVADAFPEDVKTNETIATVDGHDLMWPVQKSTKINKLFVHHTANLNVDQNKDGVIDQTDEEIALRGIYYYHSIVRGWGDIGYNYIVGPTGTVYEGRFGGDRVVGAHAVWRNISSVGVSAMGNFEEEKLGDIQRAGIAKALAYLSKKYSLDPTGTTFFYGKNTPTIQGHRDSDEASTACPGKDIYSQLDTIRSLTKDAMNGINVTPSTPLGGVKNPAFTSSYIPLQETTFGPGETKTLQIKLANSGTETWDKSTFLAIQNTDVSGFRVLSGDKTAAKAAVIDGITPPGDTATFTLTLQARYKGFSGAIKMLPLGGGKYTMATFDIPVVMKKGTVSFSNGAATLTATSHTFAEPVRGQVTLTNSGDVTWEKDGDSAAYIEIGASGADGKVNPLPTQGVLPKDVKPGESVSVPFEVLAPLREGTFSMGFTLRIRGDSNLFGTPVRASTMIVHPGEQTRLVLTLNAMATPDLVTSVDTAGTYVMYVTNTGSTTWENLSLLEPDLKISSPVTGLTVSRGVFDDRILEAGKSTAVRFPFQTGYIPSTTSATLSLDLAGKNFVKGITKSVTIQDKKIQGVLLSNTVTSSNDLASIQVRNTGDLVWHVGQVTLAVGDATVVLAGDKDVAAGSVATFQIRADKISPVGSPAKLQLTGRTDSMDLGAISLKIGPSILLEFGSHLTGFHLR